MRKKKKKHGGPLILDVCHRPISRPSRLGHTQAFLGVCATSSQECDLRCMHLGLAVAKEHVVWLDLLYHSLLLLFLPSHVLCLHLFFIQSLHGWEQINGTILAFRLLLVPFNLHISLEHGAYDLFFHHPTFIRQVGYPRLSMTEFILPPVICENFFIRLHTYNKSKPAHHSMTFNDINSVTF